MTPYTKKIVELHKIHKAIEEKDCCNGGGNTPSGDITIDDVVKFIHDDMATTQAAAIFPYTTWDEIPDYDSVDNGQMCKTTRVMDTMSSYILSCWNHIIGIKDEDDGQIS